MALIVWLVKKLFCLSLLSFLFLSFLIYAPFLLDIQPKSYKLPPRQQFIGPLKENNLLSQAQKLFVDQASGPESIAEYKGDLYTGTADGKILKISGNKLSILADVCEGKSHKCGRPLGIRVDSNGTIYFVDAYYGLKRLDAKTRKVTTLLSPKEKVEGVSSKFFDDIALAEGTGVNGGNVFYISDVSSKWDVDSLLYNVAEFDDTGRVIKFDEGSKKPSVVAKGLHFPNGMEMTDDKKAVLVAEFSTRRILKVHLTGPKVGKVEQLADNLPGEPDNIRRSANPTVETYWVALAVARNSSSIGDILSDKPFLRRAIGRLLDGIGTGLYKIGEMFNFVPLKEIGHRVRTGIDLMKREGNKYGMIVEINANGKILRSLHSPDGKVTLLSEVREVKEGNSRVLYLGSFINNYLGKLTL